MGLSTNGARGVRRRKDWLTGKRGFRLFLQLGRQLCTKVSVDGSSLAYSTFLGGSGGDQAFGIALDTSGSAYVTGFTLSTNFPTTPGSFQTTLGGSGDAFGAKLNSTGSGLVYSTYLGGSGDDRGFGIAVDSSGNAFVTGQTASINFPTASPIQLAGGGVDAFATKLNAGGSSLVYSTYLGGSGSDPAFAIAVDTLPTASAYITGLTTSTNFPTTSGALQVTSGGNTDAFVAKISEAAVVPMDIGKVNGGGSINTATGAGTFGFIVQRKSPDSPINGDLQYVNWATGTVIHSASFSSLTITGTAATFQGTCANNGEPCTFTVDVADNGEPGSNDVFTVSVSGGSAEGGVLPSGNIQVHE